jgi:hypothetical protein
MPKVTRWHWVRLQLLRFLCAAGASVGIILLSFGSIVGLLYLMDEYGGFRYFDPFYFIIVAGVGLLGTFILAAYLGRYIQKQLGSRWGLYCSTCKKDFNWPQFVVHSDKNYCVNCRSREQAAESTNMIHAELAEGTISPDNPYAAPSLASYAAVEPISGDGFIEPEIPEPEASSWWQYLLGLLLVPLFGGLLVVIAPIALVVMGCGYLNAKLGFLRVPAWLQQEVLIKRWHDFAGLLLFYASILVAGACLFGMATGLGWLEWTWQNGIVSASVVCALWLYWQMFRQLCFAPKNPQPRKSRSIWLHPLENYLVPLNECDQYRLMLHWPAEKKLESPPTLKFRTVTEHGLVLHVYDKLLKEVIHKQTFPASNLHDWNELTLAIDKSPLSDFPLERLYFVLDSLDHQAWIIPMTGATASQEWQEEQADVS